MDDRGKDLDGRVALISGAGVPASIGAVSARAAAEAGAKLVLADLPGTGLKEVLRSLSKDGFEVASHPVDLRDEVSVRALLAFVKRTFGRLDVTVNNAAATNLVPQDHGVTDMTAELWDNTFAVNTRGTMLQST